MRARAALVALLAGPALAAPFDPGMPQGAVPTLSVVEDPGRHALPVGPADASGPEALSLAGRVERRAFVLDAPDATVEAVMAAYRARLAAAGLETLLDCTGTGCGGLDFRFGVELLPPPAMLADAQDFAQLSAGGEAAHVSVLASRLMGRVHVQTVTVTGGAEAVALAPSADPDPGEAAWTGASGESLRARLERRGHVPVAGLDFATGGARLSDSSGAALDRLAQALVADPGLSVVIVGHTDNQGSAEVNLALSRQRAEAVLAALVSRGVPAGQLSAEGVGFLAPLASNETEAGRAANRRVELVKR